MTPDTSQKIQEIITQYRALGWHSVRAVEITNHKHPIIALWPNSEGTFTAHMNLAGDEPGISSVSLFSERALGTFWFKGRHLTPQAAKVIVEALTGRVFEIETEAIEEVEETGALAEYNHRYQK